MTPMKKRWNAVLDAAALVVTAALARVRAVMVTPKPSSSRRKKRATDSDIKKAFNDVCDDLDREREERMEQEWQESIRIAQATWPNKEQCWTEVTKLLLYLDIPRLAKVFKKSNPDLSSFLIQRHTVWNSNLAAKCQEKERGRVTRVNRDWPELANDLKRWAHEKWLPSDYHGIARKVENPMAAKAIREWCNEKREQIERDARAKMVKSAKNIVKVFPDKDKIKGILRGHFSWDHHEIYKLLPQDMRNAIVLGTYSMPSTSRSSSHDRGSTPTPNRGSNESSKCDQLVMELLGIFSIP